MHISDVSCAILVRLRWGTRVGQRGRSARQLPGGRQPKRRRYLTIIVVGMVILIQVSFPHAEDFLRNLSEIFCARLQQIHQPRRTPGS